MKIGIIGLGFVGLSFACVLGSKKFQVLGYDSDIRKSRQLQNGISPFYEPHLDETLASALKHGLTIVTDIAKVVNQCKFIFITVGTPQADDGSIDLSMIKSVTSQIAGLLKRTKNNPTIIVKSTVIPGTSLQVILPILERISNKRAGKGFGLISNPEFLRESMAIYDTLNPHLIVLGGNKNKHLKSLEKFYRVLHKDTPLIITNNQTAELIKYANNSFLATKISFINQIANLCQNIPGANVEDVSKAIGLDPRIGTLFLNAGPGYGGSCLPKDIKAIINFSNKLGVKPILLDAVETINNNQIKNLTTMIKKSIGSFKGKDITILGLAFKADTDDIRDSISLKLIRILLKNGARIKVHDYKAIQNTKKIFGDKIFYSESLDDALANSDCAVIMTPWKEYSNINQNNIKKMKKKIIIDTRRILNGKRLRVEYLPIGIGK